ncbi:hypothetical protein KIK06_19285 [Nocardiopsis sp. EMB25]|uniref:HAAS signaling domain-containing protein n=1 Tax=Nocardiopsis TaxID=2013 RepID=UPI0003498EEF|nr:MULTISPECIES: hypothetical protein [Nocardiopsis]MCY9786038.1 hypothetical protein [Nocardiopsis sp. EMB25]
MSQRSEQLVLDYLSEVGLILHGRMTARERTAYLADLRSRIDARRAAGGDPGPDAAREVLRSFGTPKDLVRRECEGRDLDIQDDELIPPQPAQANREPPPWRGGPNRGLMALLDGTGRPEADTSGASRTGPVRGVALVVRACPGEAAALGLMLLTVPWRWDLAFVWVLAAALIVLSRVWSTRDKWVGVGLPVVSCAVAMLLWDGEAKFIDRYIQESLPATGVIGLGLACLVCVFYLYPRALRSALVGDRAREGVVEG